MGKVPRAVGMKLITTLSPALTSSSIKSSLMMKLWGIRKVSLFKINSTGFPASTIRWLGWYE